MYGRMPAVAAAPLGVGGRGHGRLREDEHEHQYAEEPPTPGREVGRGILTLRQERAEPLQLGHEPPGKAAARRSKAEINRRRSRVLATCIRWPAHSMTSSRVTIR